MTDPKKPLTLRRFKRMLSQPLELVFVKLLFLTVRLMPALVARSSTG